MKKFIINTYKSFVNKFNKAGSLKKAGYIAIIPLFIFLLSRGLSPLHKINKLNKLVQTDSFFIEQYDSIYDNPELVPLVREKAYKEALVKLADNDSINLIVNLYDSIVGITIKGVTIHQTKIEFIKVKPLLAKLPDIIYVKLFSQPLRIIKEYATIVKEPIVVRHAPKNEAEAALNAYMPDTLIQNPAFLQMKLDYNIDLIFMQDNNPVFKDKWVCFIFKTKILAKNSLKSLANFCCFKKQDYKLPIIIKIPVDDLRAIYRALPINAKVVLYYNL
ncbi:MAG: hypothetical protein JXB17_07040 [Bacteroidales bacterium]|nr:hypothetical protein [Bacteroidales bacterium]